jgi:plastocyanin
MHSMIRPFRLCLLLGALLLVAAGSAAPASAAERTYKLKFGPMELGGYQVRQDSTDDIPTPKVNGYITRMRAYVSDRRGRPIPIQRVMLHHVLFTNRGRFDGDRSDGACPGIPRERFMGTGEEQQDVDLPPGYGIPIHKKDRWRAAWMLMNHRKRRDIGYIRYEVTVETSKKLTPVKAYWLDVTRCRGSVFYNIPGGGAPGSINSKKMTWKPPFDGRIVAGGAHLHGGTTGMRMYQKSCADRRIVDSTPHYGMPEHPYYNVLPVLHEPGPIKTAWFKTPTGIPVRKGEPITVAGDYDAERIHVRVMSVMHVYMARAGVGGVPGVGDTCGPLPDDMTSATTDEPGRFEPPPWEVPLTGLDENGKAVEIDRPPGAVKVRNGPTKVTVKDYSFSEPNLSIPLGGRITWRFPDTVAHDVTVANGPLGFSAPFSRLGRTYTQEFTRPGKYRLFCSLHPVVMHEVVDVRDPEGGGAPAASARSRRAGPPVGPGGPVPAGPVIRW